RSADARRDDEPDSSTFEFFVELYSIENFFARKLRRQTRRQIESCKKLHNRFALFRRQSSSFHRDAASGHNSKAHSFSVQESSVISGTLDRMPDCVAEIQKRALAGPVALVFRDDARFDLDVALDEPL